MKPRDLRKYLFDIIEAARLLAEFASGKTLAQYEADAMLRSAVERQFQIIGEALTQALRVNPQLEERISHTRQIIAFRNILVHGYADVANDIVWIALQEDLPVLHREVEALMRVLDEEQR